LQGGVSGSAGPFRLGDGVDSLIASVDEVRVWSVARSEAEVAADRGLPVAEQADLVANYRFDYLGTASIENIVTGRRFDSVLASVVNADYALTSTTVTFAEDLSVDRDNDTYAYLSTDSDADGIADFWELVYFGSLDTADAVSDSDLDTLTDRYEYFVGGDPRTTDVALLAADGDADGLTNIQEQAYGTDPDLADSDDDGVDDGAEVLAGTDPLDSRSPFQLRVLDVALAADGVSVAVHAEQQKLNLGVFTVEAWVNPDALAANSVIVKKASGTATAYSLTVDAAGNVIPFSPLAVVCS